MKSPLCFVPYIEGVDFIDVVESLWCFFDSGDAGVGIGIGIGIGI